MFWENPYEIVSFLIVVSVVVAKLLFRLCHSYFFVTISTKKITSLSNGNLFVQIKNIYLAANIWHKKHRKLIMNENEIVHLMLKK